jgi:hypothetical protein
VDVPHFVEHELVERMVEAYRLQTELWGLPWPAAWTSLRPEHGEERLSVALTDGRTWYHGRAPMSGMASIALNVSGYRGADDTQMTEDLMSTFHHELFHNLQRAIHQSYGGDGNLGWHPDVWQFFSEGTAVLAASVALPTAHFTLVLGVGSYTSNANVFLTRNSYGQEMIAPPFAANPSIPDAMDYEAVPPGAADGLSLSRPRSYESMPPYAAALVWRFLYEQCGGMHAGIEDPAAGMAVIRRALSVLYSGEIADVANSADLVAHLPEVMDRALAGTACPFQTWDDALVHLSCAIYALRLAGGRCTEPGLPAGCGLYDPNGLYLEPPVGTVTYTGADQEYPMAIPSSYGMAFVDVVLDSAVDGQSLTIELIGAPEGEARFNVQVWTLTEAGPSGRPQRIPAQLAGPEVLADQDGDGHVSTRIRLIDLAEFNRLGLIITRVDANERIDPVGAFTIRVRAGEDTIG